MASYSLLDLFFGPSTKRFLGIDLPKRPVTEFVGAVRVEDIEVDTATRVTIGVSVDVTNDADPYVAVRSRVGNLTTTNATPLDVVLDTMSANGAWAVDVVVTYRDTSGAVGGRTKLTALVSRVGALTSLSAVGSDALGSGGGSATLTVDGDDVQLTVTGVGATTIRWGYEARLQKQGF